MLIIIAELFQSVGCLCNDDLLHGEYCEMHTPPCNFTTCFENVICNNSAPDPHHPCGPCPVGYTGDGVSCAGKSYTFIHIRSC